ncbi:hypothetical protein KMZ29_07900 [Bradyrhizobium sediminis]|uniref:Uncharacterized protein n=1 Tax=Bradyrhizobium sediminis TaxID=2840469 RepID=A0A975NHI7_9BRAD|nr:hypothetical protein KMZ29_07900 [Bradyrhizobium sediminis]
MDARAVANVRRHTPTFLAALRSNRIDTPCAIDGPIKGKSFRGYAEQMPIPTLKPDDIIDNPGSPDLNPVQQAKPKTLLRNEARRSPPNARKATKTVI